MPYRTKAIATYSPIWNLIVEVPRHFSDSAEIDALLQHSSSTYRSILDLLIGAAP